MLILFLILPLIPAGAVSRVFPEIRFQLPEGDSFSPNGDGFRDNIPLRIDLSGGKGIEIVDWQLNLYGSEGRIRSYVPDMRVQKERGIFAREPDSARPPRSLLWDGRDEKGKMQSDGRYRFELRVEFNYNRIVRYYSKEVFIDTVLPPISVKPARSYVVRRPGPDGKLKSPEGEIVIEQSSISEPGLRFVGRILDDSGRPVEVRKWDGALPGKIAWNGLQSNGEAASAGVYRYELEWSDAAGNRRKTGCYQLLVIDGGGSPVNLLSTDFFFVDQSGRSASPVGLLSIQSGPRDRPAFLRLERRKPGVFRDGPWEVATRFPTEPVSNLAAGRSFFRNLVEPELVRLVGVNEANKVTTAPLYYFVDPAPPVAGLRVDSLRWSPSLVPDANATLRLFPRYASSTPIAAWSLICYLDTGDSLYSLREWKGDAFLPDEIQWTGDVNVASLAAGEKLYFEFKVMDAAGHSAQVRSPAVRIGSFFTPAAPRSSDLRGLITLGDSFREGAFSEEGERLLDEAASSFKKLDGYELRVRVFLSFQGEEEENLRKSEDLARRIRDALVERGVSPGVAFFRGEGETDLLSEGEDSLSFYRNNRVVLELRHISGQP